MFLLVTEDVRTVGGNIGCDILLTVVKKLFFPPFFNSVKGVKLLGGIGDSVRVYHIDREVSFDNRRSKISKPKDFLQKSCKSSHPTVGPCSIRFKPQFAL